MLRQAPPSGKSIVFMHTINSTLSSQRLASRGGWFATWLLSDGADLRWMGHATIAQTADTCGHVQPERHESAVERVDYVQ
jgi:hypothetical protein